MQSLIGLFLGIIVGAAGASLYWWNSEPRSYGECMLAVTKTWALDEVLIARQVCNQRFPTD